MVDLITRSTKLEDAMLADYPGIIIPTEQCEKDTSIPNVKFYKFKNLEEDELMKFLEKYKDYDYIVLNEDKLIASNKVKKVEVNWSEVLRGLTSDN